MTAKEEALAAIEAGLKMLDAKEALTGLRQRLLVTTLEHAQTQVLKIEELKRPRRGRKDNPPPRHSKQNRGAIEQGGAVQ